jgi:hypothetical protein
MKPQHENRILVMYAKDMRDIPFDCKGVAKRSSYWTVVNYPVPESAAYTNERLEYIWRQMNVVDGTELPITLKCRSMSVGDIAIDIDGQGWIVASVGWEKVELTD